MKTQARTQIYCRCGAATRDGAAVCESCLTDLFNLLTDDVPWLDAQLDVSIGGQRAVTLGGGFSQGETGVVLNPRASAARRRLHRVLEQWVRFCLEHDVRNSAPDPRSPRENASITVLGEWLSWRVDGLAWWPSAYSARSGVRAAVDHARAVVDWKPPVRIFLGKCGLPISIEDKKLRCPGDVYAVQDDDGVVAETGYCRTCGQAHLVAGQRAKLEAELDRRLCTAAEIARMMVYLGSDGSSDKLRDRVRNKINQWHTRGVITPTPCAATRVDAQPRYRYGEIRGRLAVEFRRDESA